MATPRLVQVHTIRGQAPLGPPKGTGIIMRKNLVIAVLIIVLLAVSGAAQNFIDLATMVGTSILGVANGGL